MAGLKQYQNTVPVNLPEPIEEVARFGEVGNEE
jgi:hypothetical protein